MGELKALHIEHSQLRESEIIRRILSGEKALFEILLRRNNQKLFRAVRSYLQDDAEIQDVMQNSYLKAYEKLFQFKHQSTFSTWLIRIAINESLLRLKEKGKTRKLYESFSDSNSSCIMDEIDSNHLNPEKRIIRQEARQLLEKTIDSLDQKYRIVYVLKAVENMAIADIAQSLDLSESNVKVRLHRAKNMLKEKLFEQAVDSGDVFEFGHSKCDQLTEQVMSKI